MAVNMIRVNWRRPREAFVGTVLLLAVLQIHIVDAVRLTSKALTASEAETESDPSYTSILSRTKRTFGAGGAFDLQKAFDQVINPPSISNQLTAATVWGGTIMIGWIVGGKFFFKKINQFCVHSKMQQKCKQVAQE